jgi:hypothetical protein
MAYKQKIRKAKGYIVSCPRIPDGKFFKTKKDAIKEMERQMRAGSTQSGILEVK